MQNLLIIPLIYLQQNKMATYNTAWCYEKHTPHWIQYYWKFLIKRNTKPLHVKAKNGGIPD